MKVRKLAGALLAIGITAVSSAQAQEAHKLVLTTELGLSTMWNTEMNVSPFGLSTNPNTLASNPPYMHKSSYSTSLGKPLA